MPQSPVKRRIIKIYAKGQLRHIKNERDVLGPKDTPRVFRLMAIARTKPSPSPEPCDTNRKGIPQRKNTKSNVLHAGSI